MNNNIPNMKNEEDNIDINEENLSYLKEIENNASFKENYDDALIEKYKLPLAYNIQKEDSFNEEAHYSLLKELEDKWSYIERNKPILAKRQHCDTTSMVSLKTNSRSRLQDWKAIIEESKKKYQQQKKANVLPSEDFASFVKAKCEQLQMISNKNSNQTKDKSTMITNNKNIKSFLKQDYNDNEMSHSTLRNSMPMETKEDKPVKVILSNKTIIGCASLKRDNGNCLNNKMKDVFYSITEKNNNANDLVKNHKPNTNMRILSDINQKDLTMTKLNRHFDEIMTKIKPNNTLNKDFNQLNTSLKIKPRNNNHIISNSNNEYQKMTPNDQTKNQIKIIKKINENTVLLNELLPCTKKHKGPFFYYSNSNTNKNQHVSNQRSLTLTGNNISHSFNKNQKHCLYSKNDFQSIQAKLYGVYSHKINQLMKD